jgi:two-component system response regulator
MLTLDIGNLSQAQLSDAVIGHCARFGTVNGVKIMAPTAQRKYAIAAVEMSDAVEADRVRVQGGDQKIGSVVIIRLMPPLDSSPAAVHASREPAATPVPDEPIDILLVEDDPADVRMTREALEAAGVRHRLHVVSDGLEAISFLSRTRQFDDAPEPHVVLVDLNLPKINGHEVLLEIKSSDHLRHIPVVVLTSSKAQRDVSLSYQADADWFLTKPTGLDAYAEAMRKVEALVTH